MTKLRVLVVDDETVARRNLVILLGDDPDVADVTECASGQAAIAEMRRSKPDIVFLDVQMPECDGFDVFELMGADMPPAVIFVTAYDEYALRAFDAGALDYLLKPFSDARFHRALRRGKERLALDPKDKRGRTTQLVVKSRGKTVFLNTADVDWIEAADYCAYLHVGSATHVLRRSLNALEEELDGRTFIRIHRSFIVNRERIRELELQSGGDYEVVLRSGARLPMSRRRSKNLTEAS